MEKKHLRITWSIAIFVWLVPSPFTWLMERLDFANFILVILTLISLGFFAAAGVIRYFKKEAQDIETCWKLLSLGIIFIFFAYMALLYVVI